MQQTRLKFVAPRKQGDLKTTGLYTKEEEEEEEMEKLKRDILFVLPKQEESLLDDKYNENED